MTPQEFKEVRTDELGMTQAALAQELGCNVQTIKRYEAGERKISLLVQKSLVRIVDHHKRILAHLGEEYTTHNTVN